MITPPCPHSHASMDYLPCGNLSFSQLTWGTSVSIDPYMLDSYYLLSMPTSGHARFVLDGYETLVGKDCMGIVNASQRFHFTTSPDFHQILLRMERTMVDACWHGLTGHPTETPIIFAPAVPQSSSAWQALEPILSLLPRCMGNDQHASEPSLLVCRLEEMLITTLLLNHPHSHTRQLGLRPVQTTPKQLSRAKEFMVTHLDSPLRLTDVALHVDTSTRHLQTLFQKRHHCGPMQWLKEQRLHAVRAALLTSQGQSARISDIAMRYGFSHLGEFSKAYKHLFGETPRLTRGRSSSA